MLLNQVRCAILALSVLSATSFANVDQVWRCGRWGYEGGLTIKIDFKHLVACVEPAGNRSLNCDQSSGTKLDILGTWPETFEIDGYVFQTTLVGLRNGPDWATVRFFSGHGEQNNFHADIQGNVMRATEPTRDPYGPLAKGAGYCRRLR
jgi:hypothetical protein